MTTLALCGVELINARSRVDDLWFADNQAVFDEFANVLTRVGVADLVDFIWVKPDLSLAAAENACCEAFLGTKIDPIKSANVVECSVASSLLNPRHCRMSLFPMDAFVVPTLSSLFC